jgi:hypothetical protein
MSQNKVPTIPFVLPLYHKMEQHLEAISTDPDITFSVRHAVGKGLEKLRKYSVPAKLHHSYILGTSTFPYLIDPISYINSESFVPHCSFAPVFAQPLVRINCPT